MCVKNFSLVFDSYLLKHFTIYNNSRLTDLIISNILRHSSCVEFLDLFRCINIHGDFTKLIDLLKLRPLKVLNVVHTQFTDENVCTVLNAASILSELWINHCSFITDNSVNCICDLKFLTTLKIESTIHGISVDGLLRIVIHCNTLSNLDISNRIILGGQQFQKTNQIWNKPWISQFIWI